jgi:hypothetical protein
MRRLGTVLLVVSLIALPTTPAVSASSVAYVDEVTVSPEQPLVGERFTVTANLRNAQSATGPLRVDAVAIRTGTDQFRERVRVRDLGRLPPGSDLEIPLSLRFDEPGTYDLRVVVFGQDADGSVRIEYPLVVTVREGGPQLSIARGDAVVGTATPVTVSTSNGESEPIRNLRLTLASDAAAIENATWVAPTLSPGETRTVAFSVTPRTRAGELVAVLEYVTAAGKSRRVTETIPFEADPLELDVALDASVGREGASPPVTVTVSNFGNAPLEAGTVTASENGTVLARRPLPTVASDGSESVRLNVSDVETADLDVRVAFESGGERDAVSTDLRYVATPGRIELTGVDLSREDSHVRIVGSASNVGLSQVRGVVLTVLPTDGVRPVAPYRDFFVGTVPASDFVSFDLTAEIDGGVQTVPVEITYVVDGERVTEVVRLDVSDLPPAPTEGGSSPIPPLVIVVGVVAVVALVGAAVWYRRR